MDEKPVSLFKNGALELVPLLIRKTIIYCKCIYNFKYKSNDSMERYKVQLVSRGYS